MWTWTTQIHSTPHLPTTIANSTHYHLAISASARRTHSPNASNQVNLKGLGLAVLNLTSQKSNPNQIQQENEELVADGGQLSGSDVLLALQQADLRKKNTQKIGKGAKRSKKGSSLSGLSDDDELEKDGFEENSCVKPLMIKSEWSQRIEDLEKRLLEVCRCLMLQTGASQG